MSLHADQSWFFLSVPNSEEEIEELTYFPTVGTVEVQEDLMHLAFQVESMSDFQIHLESIGQSFSRSTESSYGSVFAFVDALMDMRLKSLNDLKSDLPHFLLMMKKSLIFFDFYPFVLCGCMPEKNFTGTTNFKQRNVVVQWL